MGTGMQNVVTKTSRKSGQLIFPNVWLLIPVEKENQSTHHNNQNKNISNKKKALSFTIALRSAKSDILPVSRSFSCTADTVCKMSG